MFDAFIDSPWGLPLLCAALAAMLVSPGFMSPYMNRLAIPTPMPARFPLRSFSRAVLVVYIVLINAISLGVAHRLPLGTTLIATGLLMLLFLPADGSGEEPATHA